MRDLLEEALAGCWAQAPPCQQCGRAPMVITGNPSPKALDRVRCPFCDVPLFPPAIDLVVIDETRPMPAVPLALPAPRFPFISAEPGPNLFRVEESES